ncbi:hypothetical protein GGR56DRAFT_667513 [Xylariaceae sp. FL0804]|nr:hypothetical protein GGR56DRAFT_667513 [Xylariaceae sp. FL0804]
MPSSKQCLAPHHPLAYGSRQLHRHVLLPIAVLVLAVLLSARYISKSSNPPPAPAPRTGHGPDDDGASSCISQDSANPVWATYPDAVTGTLNGTMLIIPIPLSLARALVPPRWGIAEAAYRALLPPSFPADAYPLLAQVVHDHDVRPPAAWGWGDDDGSVRMPDFSRAAFEFPFVDPFFSSGSSTDGGDGGGLSGSSFRWAGASLMSAGNPAAIAGAEAYGMAVYPASFDPPCDAYRTLPDGTMSAAGWGGDAARNSSSSSRSKFLTLEVRPAAVTGDVDEVPYPLSFMQNVTNQPTFADPSVCCDNYRRLFNTSLTAGAHAPVPVVGRVCADMDPFPAGARAWDGVYGWSFAAAFLEPPVPSACTPG